MTAPLQRLLPTRTDDTLDRFLVYAAEKKLELYPAQEEAILELYSGKNVILNTPTGSGKSLVATALHFRSLAEGRRSYYTSPIKALVNEKFLALCQDFGPDQVGMITGDATVNAGAPIICCTAEILANDALRGGARAPIDDVVIDEFHFYSDRERGVAWQIPLLALPQARFLLMSATLGETGVFERALTELNHLETIVVRGMQRPVPLDFEYAEIPLHELVPKLIATGRAPVYVVCFTQASCAEEAQNFLSIDFCTKDEKRAITEAIQAAGANFNSPYGKEIQKFLRHGVGIHHAGLLPKYRVLVERLAQRGLLKIICGTDTLGVGVNIPIRTVLFTKLCKYDGEKTAILTVRDFQQIAGRAGRKGFDDRGTVVVMAPEHVIENLRAEAKAAGDTKKLKKLVKKKPPEKGFVPWTKDTFEKLVKGQPEALISRFQITHAMLLNVFAREEEDGCRAMRQIIRVSHETPVAKRRFGKTAFQLFRSLLDRKLLEIIPRGERAGPRKIRLNIDLQQDFSLHQALSLYLIDTVKLLDLQDADYALDLLTLVESILENPELILRKQLDRIKTERMAEMKAEGIEYDQRIEELEKLEYPKPNRDFIYDTFNDFAAAHPWVGQDNIRPKSIAREMYGMFQSFDEYIRDNDLQRAEGLLLRYLAEVYKALVQTVPDYAKTEEVYGMEDYLGSMVRRVDSSLLDEWEKLRNPNYVSPVAATVEATTGLTDITLNKKGFTVLVRNEVFRIVRALANGDFETVLEASDPGITLDVLEAAGKEYRADHSRILTTTAARAASYSRISEEGTVWTVEQILTDPEEKNDWSAKFKVDLRASRETRKPVVSFEGVGAL